MKYNEIQERADVMKNNPRPDDRSLYTNSADAAPSTEIEVDVTKTEMQSKIATLYGEYADQLTATLRKFYGDGPPDPEDVAHQAFQRVLERGDIGSILNLRAFVWRTARNLVLAAKRSTGVRIRYDYEVEQIYFPLKGDESTPESIIEAKEQLERVNDLLLRMPQKRRRALMLHRVDGLNIAEVGRRLGISRSTAAQHIARAAADLDLMVLRSEDK